MGSGDGVKKILKRDRDDLCTVRGRVEWWVNVLCSGISGQMQF